MTTNTYDSDGNLSSTTKPDGSVFTFNKDGETTKEIYSNGFAREFTHRTNQTVITGSNGINITYNKNAFGEIEEYKLDNGENDKHYSYTYDSDGNITTISLNGTLQQTFTYNASNELVRVDDAVADQTITYEYDYVGNITAVKTYAYTIGTLGAPTATENYTYNSQNQRTDLTYDTAGNLTELNGYTFGWTGRRLTSAVSENANISYTYNHNGIRTSKTIGGTTIIYTVDENNNVIEQTDGTNTMKFIYDSEHSPLYMEYNETLYYYEKNLQGDIVGILDTNGNTVVQYSYNIWGKLLSITGTLADTLGASNPLRYRGYYYDTETELYYLQSRYYAPELMRFISQDDAKISNDQGEPLGSNLYAYCLNEPVNCSDPSGSAKKYSGIVGFGIQILIMANFLCYQGFTGVEALWFAFTKNNNFGNGLTPWCYWFHGGSMGLTLDFKKILSKNFLNHPKNVLKGFGANFSVSVGITFFLIKAKRMTKPKDYAGYSRFKSVTAGGVTISKASGGNISTYGVGFTWEVGVGLKKGISIGKKLFGLARGVAYYKPILIGRNARNLYSLVASKV